MGNLVVLMVGVPFLILVFFFVSPPLVLKCSVFKKKFDTVNRYWCDTNSKRYITGLDGSVAKTSANGMIDTGFASRNRLKPRAGF